MRMIARRDAGGGLVLVTFDTPPDALAMYKYPGQYVAIGTSYFVLACGVGAPAYEILFRAGGAADDVTNALAVAPIGTTFSVTAAQGAGFPCDAANGRPLIVAVAGTGIAGARSVVAWRLAQGDAARTALYIGVRRLADLALAEEIAGWRRSGVAVTIAASREEPRRYVQDAIERAPGLPDLAGGKLFAIGPDAMITALRSLSARIGIDERDLHTNY